MRVVLTNAALQADADQLLRLGHELHGKMLEHVAEPDQRSLTWSGRGTVYTVMADAPAQTVDAVVRALPHDGPTGFWKRMSRGIGRLASWANPFH